MCLAWFLVAQVTLWDKYIDAGTKAYQQSQYAEAEKQFVAALHEAEKFGQQDGRLATSLNNLALVQKTQGRHAEAEPLHQRALAIREKALGPQHPHVPTSLNNLAMVYRAQGRYAEAEPLCRRSLAILDKALGPEHPNVATALENYAKLLRKTDREAAAAKIEARAKAIRAKHAQENPPK